jgi:hypothetical protein
VYHWPTGGSGGTRESRHALPRLQELSPGEGWPTEDSTEVSVLERSTRMSAREISEGSVLFWEVEVVKRYASAGLLETSGGFVGGGGRFGSARWSNASPKWRGVAEVGLENTEWLKRLLALSEEGIYAEARGATRRVDTAVAVGCKGRLSAAVAADWTASPPFRRTSFSRSTHRCAYLHEFEPPRSKNSQLLGLFRHQSVHATACA